MSRPADPRLEALVIASVKLMQLNDELRTAGFVELANSVHDVGWQVATAMGKHVAGNGVSTVEGQLS